MDLLCCGLHVSFYLLGELTKNSDQSHKGYCYWSQLKFILATASKVKDVPCLKFSTSPFMPPLLETLSFPSPSPPLLRPLSPLSSYRHLFLLQYIFLNRFSSWFVHFYIFYSLKYDFILNQWFFYIQLKHNSGIICNID